MASASVLVVITLALPARPLSVLQEQLQAFALQPIRWKGCRLISHSSSSAVARGPSPECRWLHNRWQPSQLQSACPPRARPFLICGRDAWPFRRSFSKLRGSLNDGGGDGDIGAEDVFAPLSVGDYVRVLEDAPGEMRRSRALHVVEHSALSRGSHVGACQVSDTACLLN
jgi:hypothetical protein